ncbi:MAG: hypothetical protein HXY50_17205 [Ignavibacteriaceae bacterium]|nr:hypothetical protein [Ignavibacteriaceae bacterium]
MRAVRPAIPLTILSLFATFACINPLRSLAGVPRTYTETFSSTTYKDSGQTTVDWNTAAGELRYFPFTPSQVGSLASPGNATGIAIDGDYAYVTDFSAGLLTIDISDPQNPTHLSTFAAVGQAVVASGDYVFLAAGTGGLKIVSVANPSAPVLVGSVATTGATGIAVDGDHAYIADGSSGLRVISVSNPAAPSILATYNTAGSATDAEVDGDYLYLADGSPGFLVFDITNPSSPILLTTVDTPGNNFGIDVRGNRAYVTDSTGLLLIYDLTNRSAPSLVGSVSVPSAGDVFANADRAYVAASAAGISVVDISDESAPRLVFVYDTTSARDVIVEGEHAFLADGNGGFRVIQVAVNVTESISAGSLQLGLTIDGAVGGTLAYIADSDNGFRIIDISDLGNPVSRGSLDTPNFISNVAVAGKYAYLGDGATLKVIDVSNPDAPVQAASVNLPEDVQGLFLDGNHLYLGCGNSGLRVYNVTTPTSPTLLGSYDTAGSARGIVVAGDRAYLADASAGLQIFNVANPASPVLLGTYNTPHASYEVAVGGNIAYVADRFAMQIIDVTNPVAPALISSVGSLGDVYSVGLEGDRLYVGEHSGALVVDVSDPWNPTVLYRIGGYSLFAPIPIGSYLLVGGSGFFIRVLRQDGFDATRSRGQSLALSSVSIPIVRARVSAVQSGVVNWDLTASGGSVWTSATPDGVEIQFTTFGTDLRWRTTHEVGYPVVNGVVDEATIDWFYESAESDGIADVPSDQGGEVRLSFGRSGYDFTSEAATPVTGYQVYSRVDSELLKGRVESAPVPASIEDANLPGLVSFDKERIRALEGRVFVLDGERAVGDMPSGTWEAIAWVAATQRDQYLVRVPTNGDSTGSGVPWTTYCITTHTTTPSIWYASEPDSGYSIDNIAPQVPSGLQFAAPGILAWDPPADEDFAYFSLFGSANDQFDETAVLIAHSVQTIQDVSDEPYGYYHLTSTDDADNRSGAASIAGPVVDVAGAGAPPAAFALHPLRPNPSPGPVEIVFDLPREDDVVVEIFDASGRRVCRLSEKPRAAGSHLLRWDGKDDAGRDLSGGVYFARVRAGSYEASGRVLRIE